MFLKNVEFMKLSIYNYNSENLRHLKDHFAIEMYGFEINGI